MIVKKEFKFDAAHNLIHYHGKCEKLHGHTYKLAVEVEGMPDDEGMVIDFCVLSDVVSEEVLSLLDHSYLNDILPQPTAENIAIWVWRRTERKLRSDNCHLHRVEVWETATSCAAVEANDITAEVDADA